jgi:hypothetical protein
MQQAVLVDAARRQPALLYKAFSRQYSQASSHSDARRCT